MIEIVFSTSVNFFEAQNLLHILYEYVIKALIDKCKELEPYKENMVRGMLLFDRDDLHDSCCSLLIFRKKGYDTLIQELLQQPPGEFKEKYVANIVYDAGDESNAQKKDKEEDTIETAIEAVKEGEKDMGEDEEGS